MQIHQLPEQQTVADTDEFALDTGTTTRRTPFLAMKTVISDYAHKLTNLNSTTTVNNSDVIPIDAGSGAKKITYVNLKNKIIQDAAPTYTSGDNENPSVWSSVSVIESGISLGTLLNKLSVMVKNVRWLYNRIGTTNISSLGSTITGAISALDSDPIFASASYTYTYSLGAGETLNITAGDFGISVPTGFTTFAIRSFSSGSANVIPRAILGGNTSSTSNVMQLRNVSTSSSSNVTASLTLVYVASKHY